MDKCECSICDNLFDGANHRPRALPCGHGFCTQCIEAWLRQRKNDCPVCKKIYNANSATDLPVCYLLEEMLQKAAVSASQNHTEDMTGMCPKHTRIPLYFLCESHNIKVCHSCVVIDHPATSCHLISLHEEIKKKKDLKIITVQKQNQALEDIEKDLIMLDTHNTEFILENKREKQDLENKVEFLLAKIEQITQEIFEKEYTKKEIEDAITYSQRKHLQFELLENSLRAAKNIEDMEKQCMIATNEISQSQKWEGILRKKHNLIKTNQDKYVMLKRKGISRSCKVISEGGKMLIPNLSCDVDPPNSTKLIREAELKLGSSSTIVFMEFNAGGCHLGRIYIQVFANRPYGRQFVMLALGTNGPTLKGANFLNRYKNWVGVGDYVTENNSPSNMALLGSLREDNIVEPSRGMLIPYSNQEPNASFRIVTKDPETDENHFGYFGRVISGMEVIDRVASTEFKIRYITISECGIVLNY